MQSSCDNQICYFTQDENLGPVFKEREREKSRAQRARRPAASQRQLEKRCESPLANQAEGGRANSSIHRK